MDEKHNRRMLNAKMLALKELNLSAFNCKAISKYLNLIKIYGEICVTKTLFFGSEVLCQIFQRPRNLRILFHVEAFHDCTTISFVFIFTRCNFKNVSSISYHFKFHFFCDLCSLPFILFSIVNGFGVE